MADRPLGVGQRVLCSGDLIEAPALHHRREDGLDLVVEEELDDPDVLRTLGSAEESVLEASVVQRRVGCQVSSVELDVTHDAIDAVLDLKEPRMTRGVPGEQHEGAHDDHDGHHAHRDDRQESTGVEAVADQGHEPLDQQIAGVDDQGEDRDGHDDACVLEGDVESLELGLVEEHLLVDGEVLEVRNHRTLLSFGPARGGD